MGTYKKGINGPVSGKTGSVIGSRWKDIDYIKGFPRKYKNKGKPSPGQVIHQRKFTLLNTFFMKLRPMLNIGFGNYLSSATARNMAFQCNYDHAFLMDEKNELSLNYPAIQLSKGTLFTAGAEQVEPVENNRLRISWNPKTYGLSGAMDDQVHIVGYAASSDYFLWLDAKVLRYQGEAFIHCLAEEGEVIHIWLFFSDSEKKRVSPTVYLSITNQNHSN